MKNAVLIFLSLSWITTTHAQGSTCSAPIPIPMDGIVRNYASTANTGMNLICTPNVASPVTWFSFTTNATASCPLISVAAGDGQPCEIVFYPFCGSYLSSSSMCLPDGAGLWSPVPSYVLNSNTTYFLRIKTSTACTISIGAQHYYPGTNNCAGALAISTKTTRDNNACNKPTTEVAASDVCAVTLDNTAFYQFYVATTGVCLININNISCDNRNNSSSSGFQVGFFQGTCGSLTPLSCMSGTGGFIQATTPSLPAGTHVYVAIDGTSGANCSYEISGVNIYGVLASEQFRNFSAWKGPHSNTVKWTSLRDATFHYEIERSANGKEFVSIGKVSGKIGSADGTNYSFEDKQPIRYAYYRLKHTDVNGKSAISQPVLVVRKDNALLRIKLVNPAIDNLHIAIESAQRLNLRYSIFNLTGQDFQSGILNCSAGATQISKDVSRLPSGKYYIRLYNKDVHETIGFIKSGHY
ncbi:T9SS type A sorting domain-containing protein [Flavisolibacter sp. BT320]|nr:T9SS type A sorting domain-containing protein [Flavisolibacter longurius]